MSRDEMFAKAREHAEKPPTPDEWGYRLRWDEPSEFFGRYRGETADEENANRRIFLFWAEDDEPCFSRTYASLAREIDRVQPATGCTIAVVYTGDYPTSYDNAGKAFGVETEPNDAPLPALPTAEPLEDDLPF